MSVYLECEIMQLQSQLEEGNANNFSIYRWVAVPGTTYILLNSVVSFEQAFNLKTKLFENGIIQVNLGVGGCFINMSSADFAAKLAQLPNFSLIT